MAKKQKSKVEAVQVVTEAPKIETGFDESQLGSTQRDNLLMARKSNLPGFDCGISGCGWPLRVGVGGNCIASAMTGTVTCPRCKTQQIDLTQTSKARARARAAITGTSIRQPVDTSTKNVRSTFPGHRLFSGCTCAGCGSNVHFVTIIRNEVEAIKCGCGLASSNHELSKTGTEIFAEQALFNYFGPLAAVQVEAVSHVKV